MRLRLSSRFSVIAFALLILSAGAGAAITAAYSSAAPKIASVSPREPMRSTAPLMLTVNGAGFAEGLTLDITAPDGNVRSYAGNAIQQPSESSFSVTVHFDQAGAYSLVVTNPSGEASAPFVLQVGAQAPGPTIDQVEPNTVNKSPHAQAVRVTGTRFEAGLTVSVSAPTGDVQTVRGEDISNVSPNAFDARVVFDVEGQYSLVVVNPSGRSSNPVTVTVK